MAEFRWDPLKEQAALDVAAGELSDPEIGERAGVDRRTIWNWRHNDEFMTRVEEHLDEFRAHVRRRGVAVLDRRIASVNLRWRKLQQIMDERAASPEMEGVPGGETGLIVRDIKTVGKGEDAKTVDVYRVDAGLLRAWLDLEKQAAQELGQWIDNAKVEQVTKAYIQVSPEDL